METDLIVVLMDASGSMVSMKEEAIDGYNNFIEEQKTVDRDADVSLYLFNTQVETIEKTTSIDNIDKLTLDDYYTANRTALLDALGQSINETKKCSQECSVCGHSTEYDKVVFGVITDGQENASQEYSKPDIQSLVNEVQNNLDWSIVFLSADMEQISEAKDYGIKTSACLNYTDTKEGTVEAYSDMSRSVLEARTE